MHANSSGHRPHRHLTSLVLALLSIATLVWILTSQRTGEESWGITFHALFTGIGVILALLQWQAQLPSPLIPEGSSSEGTLCADPFGSALMSKRKGAIVVRVSRKWRGSTLHLMSGLQGTLASLEAISSIVERRSAGQSQFLCYFPLLAPGHYTLLAPTMQRQAQITVRPGFLSEVDWR